MTHPFLLQMNLLDNEVTGVTSTANYKDCCCLVSPTVIFIYIQVQRVSGCVIHKDSPKQVTVLMLST